MSEDFIKKFWDTQAKTHEESHSASWGDNWMIDLEIETISRHIQDGDEVLDVGCANGHSTLRQHELHKLERIRGIDYSAGMIAFAQKAKAKRKLGDELSFAVGDIRHIDQPDEAYDVVYTTRVLINLPTWEEQIRGIEECLRVAKKGGKVVLSEAFWEPLVLLNALRALKQLPPLVEHDFNRYLKKERLEKLLAQRKLSFQVEDFCSVYYLGSRFLRELVTDASAYPGYSNPVNQRFYELEREFSGGGFGIQQAYVIRK